MKAAVAKARREAAIHRTAVESLALAVPPVLASHFNSFAHCMEASVCGARLLRELGLDARLVPCALRAWDDGVHFLTAGYTRAELQKFAPDRDPDDVFGPEDEAFHVLIEARSGDMRTIVDLTAGQILPTSLALALPFAEGWPRVTQGGWTVEYDDSPRAIAIEAEILKAEAMPYEGLLADIRDLQVLARAVRLDKAAFYAQLEERNPLFMRTFTKVVAATRARFMAS